MRLNHSQNECRRTRRQPFPAGDWNRSLGRALFAKRELGLELLDHARQRRAWPPPVIGFHFRERCFERTALLHDLVELIAHGTACSEYPVRARGCRRPVVAGPARRLDGVRQHCSATWGSATIAAPTALFESRFRRCDSPPHRSSPKILTGV